MVVMASHGVLVPRSQARMHAAGVTEVLVSDSIPTPPSEEMPLRPVPIAPLLANVVERLLAARSLHDLH
jgi:phosphoribosylpyrophosphate synthetase